MKNKNEDSNGVFNFTHIDPELKKKIELYTDLLIEKNSEINLYSRRVERKQLEHLIFESVLLKKYLKGTTIIDAGSGNGIVGIPLAILMSEKKVNLVEPVKKKYNFLTMVKKEIRSENIFVFHGNIREFVFHSDPVDFSLVSRGFPDYGELIRIIKKKPGSEILMITSENKIRKNRKYMEMFVQNIYNIPYRDQIKILKLESVSRETKKRFM